MNSLSNDATNFFWDNTNKRLGIGTNAPSGKLDIQVAGAGPSTALNISNAYTTANNYGIYVSALTGATTNITAIAISGNASGATATGTKGYGISGSSQNNAINYGVAGQSIGSGALTSYGLFGSANVSVGDNFGLYTEAKGGGTNNYALVATVSGVAINKYAGIFLGGNVGIGTITPNSTLHVIGNSTTTGTTMMQNAQIASLSNGLLSVNGVGGVILLPAANVLSGSGTTGNVTFWNGSNTLTNDANLFWDNTNKRLGIGTNIPNASLSIGGPLGGTAVSPLFNTLYNGSLATTINSEFLVGSFGFNAGNQVSLGISGYRFQAGSSWTSSAVILGMNVDNTVRAGAYLSMAGNGNVGIGVAAPTYRLDVRGGDIYTQGATLYNTNGQRANIYLGDNNSLISAINGAGLSLSAYQAVDGLVLMQTTGYVGIGVPGPKNTLQVGSVNPVFLLTSNLPNPSIGFNAYVAPGWIWKTSSAGYGAFITFDPASGSLVLQNTSASSAADGNATFTSGAITIIPGPKVGILTSSPDSPLSVNGAADKTGGGSWTTFSDRRIKKDIIPFTDGLDKLKQIRPVFYRYNGKTGISDTVKQNVGIIAQEIYPIAPYTITKTNKKLNQGDSSNTELLMYNEGPMIYILINSVNELQTKIEKSEKENLILENRLRKVEAENKGIMAEINFLKEHLQLETKAVRSNK